MHQKSPARFYSTWNGACLGLLLIVFNRFYGGDQGQNRTADTGIFRASKINNLLIILEQGMLGTVRDYFFDSTG